MNDDFSKLFMYKSYSNKLQANFGEDKLENQYLETPPFALNFETDGLITDVKKLK